MKVWVISWPWFFGPTTVIFGCSPRLLLRRGYRYDCNHHRP
jgi:hypothetical protein